MDIRAHNVSSAPMGPHRALRLCEVACDGCRAGGFTGPPVADTIAARLTGRDVRAQVVARSSQVSAEAGQFTLAAALYCRRA
jgi:hypothetical protein